MQLDASNLSSNDESVINYIKELQNNYEAKIKELEFKYLEIKERYDLLIYKRFARSAEQLLADEKQQLLFNEESKKAETLETVRNKDFAEVKPHKRKKRGRKPIDPNIKREEKIIDIPESEKICACGAKLTKIGEESSEKLHIIPPRMYAEKTIRPKYACRKCEGTEDEGKPTVRMAPVEPSIIPGSIASPSLLSTIMIQKYEDHLPFYRQEKQFERIGVTISRQDMCNWQQKVYAKLKPIFDLLKTIIKSWLLIQMDETRLQVIKEEGRSYAQDSFMWLACGGPPGKHIVLYEYRETRAGKHAKEMLEGYKGYLQTDGYPGYDAAVRDMSGIIHVGCFAHVRRKYFEAMKVTAQGKTAREGIGFISRIYQIESELREKQKQHEVTDEEFQAKRKEQVQPVLNDFKAWLLENANNVPPGCLLGQAVSYSLGQWDKLVLYLESPYMTPDTNQAENLIRPFVCGRKNWLFNQSAGGAESSCGMYTLIQTAKGNGLNPAEYLNTLFEKAPYASSPEDWEKLLPWNIFTA